MRRVLLAAVLFAAVTGTSGCAVLNKVTSQSGTPGGQPAGPYEAVRRAGGLLFLSGQIGARDDGTLEPGGIQAETRRALERVKALVESEGSSMDRVVKCTVFLADIAEWEAMNVAYARFFGDRKPARTAVGGVGIPRNGRIEVECVASVG
jgi:2-iminobutanoate/2-iminopropanoate deaminase